MSELLSGELPLEQLIVTLAAVSALLCGMLAYGGLLYRDPLSARLRSIEQRRAALKAGLVAAPRRKTREHGLSVMRRVVEKLNLLRSREARKASLRLSQAGFRSGDAMVLYYFLKLCLPFVFGGAALLFVQVFEIVDLDSTTYLMVALAVVVLGAYCPDIYIRNVATKRRKALVKGVPDGLDLLVICAEAGQSLDGALQRVARELARSWPEFAEELALTAMELGLPPERRQALDNLATRTDIAPIRAVVNTLIQTERSGTPLAQSLRVLTAEYRQDRLMKAEEKAARLPAILTIPMITFILPPLFIVLIGPAILRTVDLLSRL